ncbi:MAG: HPr family phosphocarrier protein, partial [Oscillospiraceae bacterium]|nr:HPr family phosphocarrier protein [Oscillospiraceae bacterium]
MKTIRYTVTNPTGIHARPAAFLAQTCVNLSSQITIRCGDRTANGNNALQIMALKARQGDVLEITANGGDEEEALNK